MTIIDRYLLRTFLRTLLICYFSLVGLYVVFDSFTNLEEFLRCADRAGGLLGLLWAFYSYRSIVFFERTSALLALVAAMFTVAWLHRYNEMTALLSAGITRLRIVRPVILAAVGVSVGALAVRELVIPCFREELSRRPTDLIGDVPQDLQPLYDNQTDVLLRGKCTYADQARVEAPSFLLPPALSHYGTQLEAENAYYLPPEKDRPGGYLLDGVTRPADLAQRPSLRLDGQPVIITPRDAADWLEPDQCFVVSDVTFGQLTGGHAFRQFSSTAELIRGLRNPSLDFGADLRVAVHARVVQPALDIALLFLGLPLVVTRRERNVFIAVGWCLLVVSLFYAVVIGVQYLGSLYLINPALAAWLPLMLFVPPAVGLAETMWE